ncbi:MAG: phosphatidylserine decarboxylase family protein [Corynebacteriales bacterium]|nr:phosphatidylserine decarboxylase family protein [Mycobacteriales bacterium]
MIEPVSAPGLGIAASNALLSELTRHPGPKRVALIGDDPGIVEQVLDVLGPKDELLIWVADGLAALPVRARVAARSRFVTERVTVTDSIAGHMSDIDVAIVAEVLRSQVSEQLALVRPLLNASGVVSFVTPARGKGLFTADPIPGVSEHVVRDDLVLRNMPPVRVHHARFTDADPELASQLAPITRPSSVPLSTRMNIDSNGVAAAGILGGLALATKLVRPRSSAWMLPAALAAPVAAFFRDPWREIVDDPRSVVAASDGKVLAVEEVEDARFGYTENWLRIVVFLSVLDVHVNRAPVAGKVVDIICEEGGYAMAQKAAAEHNVAQYTVIDSAYGRVVTAQRTGLIARRIVNRAKIGGLLAKGERYGLIRFGSRTDVYLPAGSADALVAPGDKVSGAATLLARFRG